MAVASSSSTSVSFLSTPSARRATRLPPKISVVYAFLSTPSARRATWPLRPAPQPAYHFYPRPPRGGRLDYLRRSPLYTHFYPRPPRGGRHVISGLSRLFFYFYPRPPRGGRRCQEERKAHRKGISIHALREEGDRIDFHPDFVPRDFYPRPPRGGRPGRKRAGGDGG